MTGLKYKTVYLAPNVSQNMLESQERKAYRHGPSGGVVVRHVDGRLLVVKNTTGKIGFPKGSLEDSEFFEICAFRELREETGVRISKVFTNVIQQSQDVWFFAETDDETTHIPSDEIEWCRWMTIDEIFQIPAEEMNVSARKMREFVSKFATNDEMFQIQKNLRDSCHNIRRLLRQDAIDKYITYPTCPPLPKKYMKIDKPLEAY